MSLLKIRVARILVGRIAARELLASGSEVARRLNVACSAISRAVQRRESDADLIAAAMMILEPVAPEATQRWNNVPSPLQFGSPES